MPIDLQTEKPHFNPAIVFIEVNEEVM